MLYYILVCCRVSTVRAYLTADWLNLLCWCLVIVISFLPSFIFLPYSIFLTFAFFALSYFPFLSVISLIVFPYLSSTLSFRCLDYYMMSFNSFISILYLTLSFFPPTRYLLTIPSSLPSFPLFAFPPPILYYTILYCTVLQVNSDAEDDPNSAIAGMPVLKARTLHSIVMSCPVMLCHVT